MNNSDFLPSIFTIFFLTLGPLKTIPVFAKTTNHASAKFRQTVALQSTILATAIVILVAFIGRSILNKWGVSTNALILAGSLLLLKAAFGILSNFSIPQPPQPQPPPPEETAKIMAISPIAIPGIITPYGIAAIVVSFANAAGDRSLEIKIICLLLLMMFLNWLGMTYARQILQKLNIVTLLVVGWVLAVMQAGLAIQFIINSLRNLKIIP